MFSDLLVGRKRIRKIQGSLPFCWVVICPENGKTSFLRLLSYIVTLTLCNIARKTKSVRNCAQCAVEQLRAPNVICHLLCLQAIASMHCVAWHFVRVQLVNHRSTFNIQSRSTKKTYEIFKRELTDFATDIVELVVRDGELGEGATVTKFMTVTVKLNSHLFP